MYAGSDKAGDMRDIHHYQRAAFLCRFGDAIKLDRARIGACAHNDQFRFVFASEAGDLVIIDHFRILAHSIRHDAIVLAGEIERMTVREVASVRKIHAEDGVARFQDGQIHRHVCLAARMRLNIDVFGAEEFFGPVDCEVFDDIDELTPTIVPVPRVSLGILVREYGSYCFEHRAIREIFRRDQLQSHRLAPLLVLDSSMDLRIKFLERSMNAVHTDLTFILV